ncbi:hypothetical protein Y032_0020g79 [Ancylostoma ceylanicum]|uniref:Fanconi-associated nuclease n=1 Tax=Ancylostoma ceylanicum TaxID=53326 RepID=A0A016V1X5_9BILA|nr:hypothetical protein Y032_0020g79 [Ancylostoma ceylanicum]
MIEYLTVLPLVREDLDEQNISGKSDRSEFTRSITWLETAVDYELEDVVRSTWCAQNLQETSEINWELFQSVDDFLEFLFCCPRSGLLAVIRRVITDYCNCRSGFPDLTTWNTKTKKVAVVELKGSGDRLSTKQRLWLDYFMRHKIRAEVCHVIGGNERILVSNRIGIGCYRPENQPRKGVTLEIFYQILDIESVFSQYYDIISHFFIVYPLT